MKQLFVTDMDGTLLSTDGRVDLESASIISRLSDKGALITVATARTPATVEPLLALTRTSVPAVVLTGASLWSRRQRRFIEPCLMDSATAAAVTEICRNYGLNPMTYTLADPTRIEMYVYGSLSPKEQKFINERSRLRYKHINLLPADAAPAFLPSTVLVFALGPIDRINAAAAALRAGLHCSVSAYPDIFNPAIGNIEVFAPEVSKAAAVLRLKELTGADQLIVFGDNLNDIPMMRVADKAVAVANALPEVKAVAHEVIGPNSLPSVARCIESLIDLS